ncbi:ArsR/SmtB family transcription factor [Kitasatospora xanthocidica]|uniref:ArsR/SmtB family transcription factor n=1 Tax=Kitasatospora xanthocidica TaxID=83382 RepID=UPI0036E531BD
MQRIHFTVADLARTRVRSTLGPLAEGVLALGALDRRGSAEFAGWRTRTSRLLREQPQFVLRRKLRDPDDLVALLERDPDGGPEPRMPTGSGLSTAEGTALALSTWRIGTAPYWERIQARLDDECDACGRIVMAGGVQMLLATLHPRIVWRPPVLELLDGPEGDVHLDGRGLLLVPSVFLAGRVGRLITATRDSGVPALVYALSVGSGDATALWTDPDDDSGEALGALVGPTRAAALRALTASCTTGELAARLGISSAGASQHATVLRQSGLITTRRVNNSVLHSVTPLGRALLGRRLRQPAAAGAVPAGAVPAGAVRPRAAAR